MSVMKSLCIVAPVHNADDVRIYVKEIRSYLDSGFNVRLYARESSHTILDPNIAFHRVRSPRSRLHRFVMIFGLTISLLKEKTSVFHCHNPDTILICYVLLLFKRKVIYKHTRISQSG